MSRDVTAVNKSSALLASALVFLLSACSQEADQTAQTDTAAKTPEAQAEVIDIMSGTGGEGLQLYRDNCALCHEGGVAKAPHVVTLQMARPEMILAAMTGGIMEQQASGLDDEQRVVLAEFLAQQSLGAKSTAKPVLMCEEGASEFDYAAPPAHMGWGLAPGNTRFVDARTAGMSADDVPNLKLKWAFAHPDATRARSQPAIAGGAVFMGSQDGTIYALDVETGCARWTFNADSEVRSAISISGWKAGDDSAQPSAYFGDFNGRIYRINAVTGALIWKVLVDEHKDILITGSPKLHGGRLYVPMSSNEWASAADPGYECCTFRGGVAVLDAQTGKQIWKSHSIPQEPQLTGTLNSAGTPQWHPAGAPTWNSPTIDEVRGLLYVGTGEAYTSPAAPTSDSIIAMNLETGAIEWSYQGTAGDAWNMACTIADKANCPVENGPDLDFGAPPILTTLANGKQVILAGQKAGVVHALDPDANGKLLWKRQTGIGGFSGGVHWGMAADGGTLFVPNADTYFFGEPRGVPKPGIYALDAGSGAVKWFTPAPNVCPEDKKPACDPGLSAAITAIPGVVFAGGYDGTLRAYSAEDGSVLWDFNTLDEFMTVNGEVAEGGSIESDGPVIAGGKLFINSGYLYGARMGGNVLLVFEPSSSPKKPN